MNIQKSTVAALATVFGLAGQSQAGLTINATYAANILSDVNTIQIQNSIQHAIGIIQSTYSDNVTMKIKFQEGGGLGGSNTWILGPTYAQFKGALTADATSALDAQAVASLPGANPYLKTTGAEKGVVITNAQARALNFSVGATPDGFDGTITLNTAICFFRSSVVPSKYDLEAVTMHEIDEVMGFGGPSSMIGRSLLPNFVGSGDLFRYTAAGTRSNLGTNSVGNYLSFDSGTTNIRNFNNGLGGGDYADWASDGSAFVQNAFATPGVIVNYSSKEISFGDGVGWNVAPTPEPASMAVLAIGAAALIRRRKSKKS